jgi:hypothetical protein
MIKIHLGRTDDKGNPLIALIDDEDKALAGLSWHANRGKGDYYYAVHREGTGARERLWLHNEVMMNVIGRQLESHELVDHINLDKLDCRRANLRLATRTDNEANKAKGRRGTSRYKGVSRTKQGKWKAELTVAGQRIYLGTYENEKEAAKAYNGEAKTQFGEYARLNDV